MRPIVSSIRAAVTGVSDFLDLLLHPIFDRVAEKTTFVNSIGFVRQLEHYQKCGCLSSTTLFVTFDVSNLYTMISRDGAIAALQAFLTRHTSDRRIQSMTIDTITRLVRLVLDRNCFSFDG